VIKSCQGKDTSLPPFTRGGGGVKVAFSIAFWGGEWQHFSLGNHSWTSDTWPVLTSPARLRKKTNPNFRVTMCGTTSFLLPRGGAFLQCFADCSLCFPVLCVVFFSFFFFIYFFIFKMMGGGGG
jgi:hypothetical protein